MEHEIAGQSLPEDTGAQYTSALIIHLPWRLLLATVAVIAVAELSVMILIGFFPELPGWVDPAVDAALLSALIFPFIYFFCSVRSSFIQIRLL